MKVMVTCAYPFPGGHNVHSASHDINSEDAHIGDGQHNVSASDTPLRRLQIALEALKYQHSALAQTLSALSHLDQGTSLRGSPFLPTAQEEETQTPSTGYSTISRASRRMSMQSDGSIWFDAEEYDGAEEFVLDEAPDDSQVSKLSEMNNMGTPSSGTSDAGPESTSESSDSEEEEAEEEENEVTEISTAGTSDISPPSELAVTRRTQLPSPPAGDEGSLFAVLKKNVGKVRQSIYACRD